MNIINLVLRLTKGSAITATENDANLVALKTACTELDTEKADVASPTFTGIVTIPSGALISGYATTASPTLTGAVTVNGTLVYSVPGPVTITGAYTISASDRYIICNGTASITLTLPDPATSAGRVLGIKTIKAFTVISSASNVKPLTTNTAGTAILAASLGKWCTLVSDGASWVILEAN